MSIHPVPVPVPVLPSLADGPCAPEGLGGLLARGESAPVVFPLREVRVRAVVTGLSCRAVVEQRYGNPLSQPMEAVHIFPVPPSAAVAEVELQCGDLTVRAELRERAQAEAAFEAARSAGHRAALLTRERDDVHTLRVTNLPPGEEVTVRFVLVERLDAVDGLVRWRFPTTIAPRFMPGGATGHDGPGVHPDTEVVPDASRISPPLRLAGGTRLDLEVRVEGRPTRVVSSLHAVQLGLDDGVRVGLAAQATCDRDFVLGVSYAAATEVGARAWTDGTYTLVTVDPPAVPPVAGLPRDAVFVLDISGSMDGSKLDAARRALKAALRGLVQGDRFRLFAFDDRVEKASPDFVAYDDRAMALAERWLDGLHARGGTIMLPVLKQALAGETPAGRVRTVLFVTDGQAGDEDQLVAAVAGRRGSARLFTLGIDTAVNASLLQRLARVGGGTCELCTPSDDIEGVVAALEARVGTPLGDDLRVEGGESARPDPQALFSGRPVAFLVRGAPATVRVTGRSAAGPLAWECAVARTTERLAVPWARERVAWLEDRLTIRPFEEEALLPEIRRVALEAGIASRCTSFVVVESNRVVDGPRREVVQPVELPAEWDRGVFLGVASARPALAAPPPPAAMYQPSAPSPRPSGPAVGGAGPKFAKAAPRRAGLLDEVARVALRAFGAGGGGEEADAEAPEEAAEAGVPMMVADNLSAYEPDPQREQARGRSSAPSPGAPDAVVRLVGSQRADGSFDGGVGPTAAALVVLLLHGNTRTVGRAQRTVLKAATWLGRHAGDARADLALALLAKVEAGGVVEGDLTLLYSEGEAGGLLAGLHRP